jgi:hypothetical protein
MGGKPKPGQPWDHKQIPSVRVVVLETVANKVTFRSRRTDDVRTIELETFTDLYRKGDWSEDPTAATAGTTRPRRRG